MKKLFMKRLYTIIMALATLVVSANAQSLSVANIEAQMDEETALVVSLAEGSSMTALQFNLSLPEGVTLDETAITKGTAASGHTLEVRPLTNGDRLFVLYHKENTPLANGELLRLPVTVGSEAGTFGGKLYTVRTATADAVSHKAAEANFSVTVKETMPEHIYIETDQTAQFPTDWQGWNGATGFTSTNFAPTVTTNDGRTVQVCEKFDGSSAAEGTVFTRTLTGLTNGIYRIELYGAASSTKGRDTAISSDMTADNEGDETAVYLYAKTASGTVSRYIPIHWATSFSEVATAVLDGVEVTDGTVEIGMVSEKKYTNWHVVQIKGVTALVDAEELHANTLARAEAALSDAAHAAVTGEERTALSQAISTNTTVAEQTAEAYKAAISALDNATATFTAAQADYEKLAAAKSLVQGRSYPFAAEAKKAAAEAALTEETPTNAAACAVAAEALLTKFRQYAESSALLEGVDGSEDVTATYVKNPKADEGIDAAVWQTVLGEGSGGSIGIRSDEPWTDGSGGAVHSYFDGGNWGATAWNVTFRQDITLPAGRYLLTAVGRSAQDVAMTLFVVNGESEQGEEMAHIGATGGLFGRGWEQTSADFELAESATVSIGVRGETHAQYNWMSFSDFRLVQFPAHMTTGIGGLDAVTSPKANGKYLENGRVVIYHDGKKFSPTGIQLK